MKVKMTANYSDRLDHPRAGDILNVDEVIYNDTLGFVESYRCKWKDDCDYLDLYPYECEEVQE